MHALIQLRLHALHLSSTHHSALQALEKEAQKQRSERVRLQREERERKEALAATSSETQQQLSTEAIKSKDNAAADSSNAVSSSGPQFSVSSNGSGAATQPIAVAGLPASTAKLMTVPTAWEPKVTVAQVQCTFMMSQLPYSLYPQLPILASDTFEGQNGE